MKPPPPSWWLLGAAAAGAFFVLRAWDPATAELRLCLFRNLLELPCPGCGLTRAFAHLARGEPASMVAMHPLAPFLAAEAALGWVAWGLLAAGQPGTFSGLVSRWAPVLTVANLAPLLALWLGRAATGTLPF